MGENLANARIVKVRRDTNQTAIVTATPTALSFSNRVDLFQNNPNAWAIAQPTRIVIDAPGLYLCVGNVTWANAATGNRQAYIRKNGTTGVFGFDSRLTQATGVTTNIVACILQLKAAEYVELMALQDSGGNLVITSTVADETPSLAVTLLHRFYDASLAQEIGAI